MTVPWRLRIPLFLIITATSTVWADDVVFKDGKGVKNAQVLDQNDYIVVTMPEGPVRFPRSAIKLLNGKPPGPVRPHMAPVDVELPVQNPTPVSAPSMPAKPKPPVTSSAPVEASQAESPPIEEALVPPTPRPGEQAEELPVETSSGFPWRFEIFLALFLLASAVWMRSLQWVQKDLYERRADPRFWGMAALLLPGLGALLYLATLWISERFIWKKVSVGGTDPKAGEKKGGLSWLMPKAADPADHLREKNAVTRKGFEFLDAERKSVKFKKSSDISSGLENAQEMLEEALLERASDIHIEPGSTEYRVRFRLDGIMHERMTYDSLVGLRMLTALKTLAEIDVAEKRKAQDGRFRVRAGESEVDFRVATANSIHGEKMVIRVLDHSRGVMDLSAVGMSDSMLATFQSVIQSRNGMILATGPTGSGKTSTLYAALRQIDASRLNIMTIEDPPEYQLEGATQLAVNTKAGITYESGLRSILRQDPDVILVGEMRDLEATQVALRAALTGHLVLSSLHTKDAVGTVSRLQDMGIERYQVASALLMILAQRLVRVLCPDCREPYPAVGDELQSLGFAFEPGSTLHKSVGCEKCLGTGFKGRTGVFELLVMSEKVRQAITEGASESALAELAAEEGYRSYRYDGAEKILLGITTVEEVLQAV